MKRRSKATSYLVPIMVGTICITEALYGVQPSSYRPPMILRDRGSIKRVKDLLGDHYFKRAYRMSYEEFQNLVEILEPNIISKKGAGPNGKIAVELEVSASLRYFAGASMYDLIITHGVSHSTLFCSVWRIVSAINNCEELKISFPSDHEEQRSIAKQFLARSAAKFENRRIANSYGETDGTRIRNYKMR